MSDQDKRCGTCKLWAPDGDEGLGWCGFPKDKLPESADVSFTFEEDGTTCPCWEAKEQ